MRRETLEVEGIPVILWQGDDSERSTFELDFRRASKAAKKYFRNKGDNPEDRHDITIHSFGSLTDFETLIESIYRARKSIIKAAKQRLRSTPKAKQAEFEF